MKACKGTSSTIVSVQTMGESIFDFVAALRHLAEYCNFGGSLENMLRDRLVSGVNNEKIQRRLLYPVSSAEIGCSM